MSVLCEENPMEGRERIVMGNEYQRDQSQPDQYGNTDQSGMPQQDQYGRQQDQTGMQQDQYGNQSDQSGMQQDQYGNQQDQSGMQQDQYGNQSDQSGMQQDQTQQQQGGGLFGDARRAAEQQVDQGIDNLGNKIPGGERFTGQAKDMASKGMDELENEAERRGRDMLGGMGGGGNQQGE
jgi:hypothetical protein